MAKEYVHRAADGRRYLCVHGDGVDAISTNHRWLAMLGSLGYDVLLTVNRLYNKYLSLIHILPVVPAAAGAVQ